MEIGLNLPDETTDKQAGDIIEQFVLDLKDQGIEVLDYWIEVR